MSVGKSSIIFRFVRNRFSEQTEPTIGAAFITQVVELQQCLVKFECWDTAGQERYAPLCSIYFRAAPCCVIVYDITNQQSFKKAKDWVEEVRANGAPNCTIALVGNKLDLEPQRQVTTTEAQEYATQKDLIFMEVSAKTSDGIQELFSKIAAKLVENVKPEPAKGNLFDTTGQPLAGKPKGGCC